MADDVKATAQKGCNMDEARSISQEEYARLEAQAAAEARREIIENMIAQYPRAHTLMFEVGKCFQDTANRERVHLPAMVLALAMFATSARMSVEATFDMTPDEFDTLFEIAADVANTIAEKSTTVGVIDPRDGSRSEFASVDAAKDAIKDITDQMQKKET